LTLPTLPPDLLDRLADQVAERVIERLGSGQHDAWLDTQQAATYLGCHPDTLRKLSAKGAIPYEQERPHAKLYFRRSELDRWRTNGGAPRRLHAVANGLPKSFQSD
jgi:excisionase family DNA binding protein